MTKLQEWTKDKLEEPTMSCDVFEARNWIYFINQNVMNVVRFYSGPVKFILGWLHRVDKLIRHHITSKGC